MTDTKPKQIPHGQEQPGDFLLYRKNAAHIAVFAGGNRIIHAANPHRDTVEQDSAFTGWYGPRYTKSIRYWDGGSQGVPNTPVPGDNTSSTSNSVTPNSGGSASSPAPGAVAANPNTGGHNTSSIGAAKPAFAGVSLSVGLSGLSGKAQSILSAITGTAPWANLGPAKDSQPEQSPGGIGSTSGPTGEGNGTYNGPKGKGEKYLMDFLIAHNVTGLTLRTMWTLGMRETGGDPDNVYNPSKRVIDPNDSGKPHYDVGLFQVNNRHLKKIKEMFGPSADMYTMKDPEKNWQMTLKLSNNLTNFRDWGVSSVSESGFTHDFSGWGDSWKPGTDNYNITVNHDTKYWRDFAQYSKGSWRIEDDQIAKIHENEMVLPADVAEEVRHEWDHHQSNMTIRVVIGEASNAQAMRFAQVLKTELETEELVIANG